MSSAAERATGVDLIAAERKRQVEVEGWTPEHDAQYHKGQLARAAAYYAAGVPIFREDRRYLDGNQQLPHIIMANLWPWDTEWYKPKDRIRDLARAGALVAAELDRLLAEEADIRHE